MEHDPDLYMWWDDKYDPVGPMDKTAVEICLRLLAKHEEIAKMACRVCREFPDDDESEHIYDILDCQLKLDEEGAYVLSTRASEYIRIFYNEFVEPL